MGRVSLCCRPPASRQEISQNARLQQFARKEFRGSIEREQECVTSFGGRHSANEDKVATRGHFFEEPERETKELLVIYSSGGRERKLLRVSRAFACFETIACFVETWEKQPPMRWSELFVLTGLPIRHVWAFPIRPVCLRIVGSRRAESAVRPLPVPGPGTRRETRKHVAHETRKTCRDVQKSRCEHATSIVSRTRKDIQDFGHATKILLQAGTFRKLENARRGVHLYLVRIYRGITDSVGAQPFASLPFPVLPRPPPSSSLLLPVHLSSSLFLPPPPCSSLLLPLPLSSSPFISPPPCSSLLSAHNSLHFFFACNEFPYPVTSCPPTF